MKYRFPLTNKNYDNQLQRIVDSIAEKFEKPLDIVSYRPDEMNYVIQLLGWMMSWGAWKPVIIKRVRLFRGNDEALEVTIYDDDTRTTTIPLHLSEVRFNFTHVVNLLSAENAYQYEHCSRTLEAIVPKKQRKPKPLLLEDHQNRGHLAVATPIEHVRGEVRVGWPDPPKPMVRMGYIKIPEEVYNQSIQERDARKAAQIVLNWEQANQEVDQLTDI